MARLISVGLGQQRSLRGVPLDGTDLSIRRVLLQPVLLSFATSLPRVEHVWRGGMEIWSCGSRDFGRGWTAGWRSQKMLGIVPNMNMRYSDGIKSSGSVMSSRMDLSRPDQLLVEDLVSDCRTRILTLETRQTHHQPSRWKEQTDIDNEASTVTSLVKMDKRPARSNADVPESPNF